MVNIVQKLREELDKRNVNYQVVTPDDEDFVFPDKKIYFMVVDEEECNEKTKDKKFFKNLKKEYDEKGINLIIVYRSHLINKFDIILNRLFYKLEAGIEKVDARNCEVREVSYKESKEFLEKYHFMGNVMSKIRLGMYRENELLCIVTFGVPRYNTRYNYEINRYAIKFGYSVRGNFSKMMNYFIKTYNPKSILTYHDSLFGENTVYEQCGFKKLEDSAEGFYWYRDGQIFNRRGWWKGTLSKKLEKFDPNKSAHDNMRENNFLKIWDLGQSRYEMILENGK